MTSVENEFELRIVAVDRIKRERDELADTLARIRDAARLPKDSQEFRAAIWEQGYDARTVGTDRRQNPYREGAVFRFEYDAEKFRGTATETIADALARAAKQAAQMEDDRLREAVIAWLREHGYTVVPPEPHGMEATS